MCAQFRWGADSTFSVLNSNDIGGANTISDPVEGISNDPTVVVVPMRECSIVPVPGTVPDIDDSAGPSIFKKLPAPLDSVINTSRATLNAKGNTKQKWLRL